MTLKDATALMRARLANGMSLEDARALFDREWTGAAETERIPGPADEAKAERLREMCDA